MAGLSSAGREGDVAVTEHGGGRRDAVAQVPVVAGRVVLSQAHPQAVVDVAVRVPVGEALARQAVFVVPGVGRRLPVHRLRQQVAVRVVGLALPDAPRQLVVRVSCASKTSATSL